MSGFQAWVEFLAGLAWERGHGCECCDAWVVDRWYSARIWDAATGYCAQLCEACAAEYWADDSTESAFARIYGAK